MSEQSRYWTRRVMPRRSALRAAAAAGSGGVALSFLAACGGGNDEQTASTTSAAATTAPQAALDPTQGKLGGKIVIQQYGDPGSGLKLITSRNAGVHQFSGFTHDGLLEMRTGIAGSDGYDIETQPNLAQAMPEQPDPLTFVFKLRPAKFHNGRTVTAEDVKYSYELYAFDPDSAWKRDLPWIDRVDTPDPQTVIVRSKFAYADAPQAMSARDKLEILAREHQESPEAENKLMGSGPFLFVDYQPPVMSRYRRNPEYHRQPYPYFEEIDFLGTSDTEKKIADFAARQVHMTYYFPPEGRDRVKQVRPDAQLWSYLRGSDALYMRTDKPPFNDKRVRQALSMAIDRTALSKGVTQGEGEPDQALSIAGKYWGFRKPSELGEAAKYFEQNVAEAKKLLNAAGVSLPIKFEVLHWNATVVGPQFVDTITLV
ncbi:MAG: ABC transporter substrate-binding protein, partial [Dehalococcoidia bacterium]